MTVPHRVKDRDRDGEDIVGTTRVRGAIPFRTPDEPQNRDQQDGDDQASSSSSSSSEESSVLSSLNGGGRADDSIHQEQQRNDDDNDKLLAGKNNNRQRAAAPTAEQKEQNEPSPPVDVVILEETTLDRQWDAWERRFDERERLLLRMLARKNNDSTTSSYYYYYEQQLRQRERAVRRQTLERLAQLEARDDQERAVFLRRLDPAPPPRTIPQRCGDGLVAACHSIVPALASLMVHCFAHVGIFDGLSSVVESLKSALLRQYEHDDGAVLSYHYYYYYCVALDLAVFFVGVLLLRLSSDLFWWLSDRNYDCVKFDLHNRLRLGCGDARRLVTVRERPVVRVTLFMTGFSLCYLATMVLLLQYGKQPFDQKVELLRQLPSLTRPPRQTLALVSYCSQTCQDEIQRQAAEYLVLHEADLQYTRSTFSEDSFLTYWTEWALGEQIMGNLLTQRRTRLFNLTSTILSMAMLQWLGFKFWTRF